MRKMAGRCAQRAISIRRSCHGLYVSDGVHPFVRTGILPRPAAGLLLDVYFEHDLSGKPVPGLPDHALAHDNLSKVRKSGSRKIMRKRAQMVARAN